MVETPKYKSFCFTIRPTGGVPPDSPMEADYVKFATTYKGCEAYDMWCEKKDHERHIHMQVWLSIPRTRGDVNKQIERVLKKHIGECADWQKQCRVLREGTQIAYSDWHISYCEEHGLKTLDESTIVHIGRPFDTDPYYASEEEQAKLQRKANAVDKRMASLELLWEQWSEAKEMELTQENVGTFLSDMMFNERKIMTMCKTVDMRNLCRTLFHYISKSVDSSLFYKKPDDKLSTELKSAGFSDTQINNILI